MKIRTVYTFRAGARGCAKRVEQQQPDGSWKALSQAERRALVAQATGGVQ